MLFDIQTNNDNYPAINSIIEKMQYAFNGTKELILLIKHNQIEGITGSASNQLQKKLEQIVFWQSLKI